MGGVRFALLVASLIVLVPSAAAAPRIEGFATDLPNNEDAVLLRNLGAADFSLADATLQDGSGELGFPADATLGPQTNAYVATNWTAFVEGFGREPDFALDATDASKRLTKNARTFALSNSGDSVSLRLGEDVLDAVAYGDLSRTVDGWQGTPIDLSDSLSLRWIPRTSPADTDSLQDWVQPRRSFVGEDLFPPTSLVADGFFVPYLAPEHSRSTVRSTIVSAQHSIRLNVYQFRDIPLAEDIAAHLRSTPGLRMYVLLDGSPVGESREELSERGHVVDTLVAAGAEVHMFTHSRYAYDHAKYAVIDDQVLLVQTENFVPSGIPANGRDGNRGWGVVIANRTLAQAAAGVFDADFELRPFGARAAAESERPIYPAPALGTDTGSRPSGVSIEGSAKVTLLATPFSNVGGDPITSSIRSASTSIELVQLDLSPRWRTPNGGYVPHVYLAELVRASERGVTVRLLLDGHFLDDSASGDNADTVRFLEDEHGSLPISARLRSGSSVLHAKGMVVDGRVTLVGSMNWNSNSVLQNRELGVLVEDRTIAEFFRGSFEQDWSDAGPERVPALDVVTVLTLAGLAMLFRGPRRR